MTVGACDSVNDAAGPPESDLDEAFASKNFASNSGVVVMTRNMYVGTDVDKILLAQAPEEVPILVAEAFGMLQQTNYPERAKAMAKEIAKARPHLVGLQEVTRVRLQTPGDAVFGGTAPAEDVFLDFLPTLLDELSVLGQSYRAVAEVENIDIEMPMITDPITFSFTDVRLTDYDVILARSDVVIDHVESQNFAASFEVFGSQIKRGYIAVNADIDGKTYRFVSTHLEPVETGDGIIQQYQAGELVGLLSSESKPLILVGDFNSDAPTGSTYGLLIGNGYQDAWAGRMTRRQNGYTCCQEKDLSNVVSVLDRRIDHVFFKNFEDLWPRADHPRVHAQLVGNTHRGKTTSGLWPSDHAGVVARFIITPERREWHK
jgi:endonuclease/exonuclease/phosphatase family metal-dependent hydrolase